MADKARRPQPTAQAPRGQDGFSLVEVLVALVVFALGSAALLNVLGQGATTQSAAYDRAIARVIAENRMVEAMATSGPPGEGVSTGEEEAMTRRWQWERSVAATQNARIFRIDVRVRLADGQQTLAEVTSFRATR